MKYILSFIVLFLALFLVGCTSECNTPYIKVGTSCCLDQNNNNICDNDESGGINAESSTQQTLAADGLTIESHSIKFKKGSSSKYDTYTIVGELKNNNNEPDKYAKAIFTGYDLKNSIVCTKYTYASSEIKSQQTGPFEMTLYAEDCPELYRYKLQTSDQEITALINDSITVPIAGLISNLERDKCADVSDWTVEGAENQKEICYTGKYIDYAISKIMLVFVMIYLMGRI